MAEPLFDFEQCYLNKVLHTEINVDISGLNLKSNPSSTADNEDGSADEVNMNQYITNNVMYRVSRMVVTTAAGSFIAGEQDTIRFNITYQNPDNPSDDSTASPDTPKSAAELEGEDFDDMTKMYRNVYTGIGYSIDDLCAADILHIPESKRMMEPTLINSGVQEDGITRLKITFRHESNGAMTNDPVSQVVIYVTPRFRLQNPYLAALSRNNHPAYGTDFDSAPYYAVPSQSPAFTNVDQNIWHMKSVKDLQRLYGAIGLMDSGERYPGFEWYSDQQSSDPTAVIWYDTFRHRIKAMADIMNEYGIGIDVTYYDDNYKDEKPDTLKDATKAEWKRNPFRAQSKHYKYLMALDKLDWTKTYIPTNATFSQVYGSGALKKFFDKALERGVIADMSGSGVTAVVPNMVDVFKSYYYQANELADAFNSKYFSLYGKLMDFKGVQTFMSSSLKRKLRKERLAYKVSAVDEGLSPSFAVDLTSFYKMLLSSGVNGNYATDWKTGSTTLDKSNQSGHILPRALSQCYEISRVVHIDLSDQTSPKMVFETYPADLLVTSNKKTSDVRDLLYSTTADRIRSHTMGADSVYYDWVIDTEEMTLDEVKEQLAEYYTSVYNKLRDLDDDDEGYAIFYPNEVVVNIYDPEDTSSDNDDKDIIQVNIPYSETASLHAEVMPTFDELKRYAVEAYNVQHNQKPANASETYGLVEFNGSCLQYIKKCIAYMNALTDPSTVADMDVKTIACDLTEDANRTYQVIKWSECSTPGNPISYLDYDPCYKIEENVSKLTNLDIDHCVNFAEDTMAEVIDEIESILTLQSLVLGAAYLVWAKVRVKHLEREYNRLMNIIDKIKWYQLYTNESVFENKTFVGDRGKFGNKLYIHMPGRLFVPVEMYKKVRKKYKVLGFFTRHRMVKESIGVRWAEIKFVDNNVFSAYPINNNETRQFYPIGKYATITKATLSEDTKSGILAGSHTLFTFDVPLEDDPDLHLTGGDITKFTHGDLVMTDADGVEYGVVYKNNSQVFTSFDVDLDEFVSGEQVFVHGIYVPLDPTESNDDQSSIRVEYKMPYIPTDSEIKRWAFMNYGPFDQSKYAEQSREVPADGTRPDGWRIFRPSSKRIGDLRASMGIYDAVAILMGILRNHYGANRVELIETMRSLDDQERICSGSEESKFLSWHNYGLAVKIMINDAETGMPIQDKTEDWWDLINIAEAFTEACRNGAFGKPLNVVWCGRLVMGANNFVWEFLPIGVGHKDAPKFREALLNQEDPVASFGYIDVDAAGFVYDRKPTDKVPYVLSGGTVYKNAEIINGHHYVSPKNIRNYTTPHNLVLLNILEFLNLVETKMGANGSKLENGATMSSWMALNPESYRQLIMYFGMTGSISAAKALIGGEYVERYQNIVDTKFSENYVVMVKQFLGNLYDDAKVLINDIGDGGAWISLRDGKIHVKVTDMIPDYNMSFKQHFHGTQQVTPSKRLQGMWVKGVFYTTEELEAMNYEVETVSEYAVIKGYGVDGEVEGGDAMTLHALLASQIKKEFDKVRSQFNDYGGQLMFDHYVDGPNYKMATMLENEFGLIVAQDLMSFDRLRAMMNRGIINSNAQISTDGTVNGAGVNEEDSISDIDNWGTKNNGDDGGYGNEQMPESIYEKVVSNAMLSGARYAKLTGEHVQVNARVSSMTIEQMYKRIQQGRSYVANDILSR
ncbi:MAG: hypothetical protein MJZ25_04000 [Fibrobacter sp.]|nr:hypothetical protein [Fibrobacter sp.]